MKKLTVFLVGVLLSGQSFALSDQQKGVLAGIAGTLIVKGLIDNRRKHAYEQQNVYTVTRTAPLRSYYAPQAPVYRGQHSPVTQYRDTYEGYPVESFQNRYRAAPSAAYGTSYRSQEAAIYYTKGVNDRLSYERRQRQYGLDNMQNSDRVRADAYRCGRYGDC